MSIPLTEQRRGNHIHVKHVVEYAAADRAAPKRHQEHQTQRVNGDVIGVLIGLIREGSAVLCHDGKAGRVAGVIPHPQRAYPTHIIVRHGWLRSRQFRVAFNWVTGIAPDYVELNLAKHDLVQQPEYCPDYEIAEAVELMFHGAEALHDRADYLAIRATVEDGIVTLRGNVRNSARRLEAERIVSRMRGVIAVQNFLFADDEIAWKAAWVLQRDPRLNIRNLHIETCLGLVRLHGEIASVSQRALATAIVKQVPGVHALNNGLNLVPILEPIPETPPINDRQRLEAAFVT